MPLFRRGTVVVEAIRVPDLLPVGPRLILDDWLLERVGSPTGARYVGREIILNTLGEKMRAQIGDWIIQGVNGELYPCKPDIFEKTYEPVDGAA